jgi:cob(I)alamin adenosyltransferase
MIRSEKTRFDSNHLKNIESWTDRLDSELPPLKNFILPSGGFTASQLHVCRTICRRAERRIWPLIESDDVDNELAVYINRYRIIYTI